MSFSLLKTCILCFSTSEEVIDLLSDSAKKLKVSNIVSKHFWFQVNKVLHFVSLGNTFTVSHILLQINGLEGFPTNLCQKCWQKTVCFHEFYKSVHAAHEAFLTQWLKTRHNDCQDEIAYDRNAYNEDIYVEPLDVEPFQAFDDDFAMDYGSESSYFNDSKVDVKSEIHEEIPSTSPLQNETKPIKVEDSTDKGKRAKRKVKNMKNDDKFAEYFDMKCDLCTEQFDTFQSAKVHYQEQHNNSLGYIKCCQRQFNSIARARSHLTWHLDPKAFP